MEFNWLHLTDLHVGMNNQDWLWPETKHLFFDDLKKQADRISKLKLVIFSGDLVQKGTKEEFARLDTILLEIWSVFRELGSNPVLFHIPGNHDLARPDARNPIYLALANFWEIPETREDFFAGKYDYKNKISSLFDEYTIWSAALLKRNEIPVLETLPGILPGDQSAVIDVDGFKIGLIGLNSTWLQFSEGNRQKKLAIDPRQLQAVTNDDPRRWCDTNDFNILITHHPIEWLHDNNIPLWNAEISPAGRFDVHIYGHMHESDTASISRYGSQVRNTMQGTSLFGLEFIGHNIAKRSHGYYASKIVQTDELLEMIVWPRTYIIAKSGTPSIRADQNFELEENNSFVLLKRKLKTTDLKKKKIIN